MALTAGEFDPNHAVDQDFISRLGIRVVQLDFIRTSKDGIE